jgi:hypothetical protein
MINEMVEQVFGKGLRVTRDWSDVQDITLSSITPPTN